jgi:hypothetical protein
MLTGCSIFEFDLRTGVSSREHFRGKPSNEELLEWAEYYLESGAARDAGEAMEMARERFWPYDEDGLVEQVEREQNKRRELEESFRTRSQGK